MLISININAQDLLDQYSISKEEVEQVIDHTIKDITAAFASKWSETAAQELKGTRDRYISNLRVVDSGRMSGAVILDYTKDPVVKMVEEGVSSFDIKIGFENSPKKHIKKDGGWYLTVPFTIGTPGTQESNFSNVMPSQIYNIARKQEINPITNRSAGISEEQLSTTTFIEPKAKPKRVIPESTAFADYKRKASVYEGVYKSKDQVTGQNVYGSFRRVSDKSDENSWIYPGIESKNLAEKSLDLFEPMIETITSASIDNALQYFGFE